MLSSSDCRLVIADRKKSLKVMLRGVPLSKALVALLRKPSQAVVPSSMVKVASLRALVRLANRPKVAVV